MFYKKDGVEVVFVELFQDGKFVLIDKQLIIELFVFVGCFELMDCLCICLFKINLCKIFIQFFIEELV